LGEIKNLNPGITWGRGLINLSADYYKTSEDLILLLTFQLPNVRNITSKKY
jgi:hypothetical protein